MDVSAIRREQGMEAGKLKLFSDDDSEQEWPHNLAQPHSITNYKHYFRGIDEQLDCIYRNLCCGQWQSFLMSLLSLPNSRKSIELCVELCGPWVYMRSTSFSKTSNGLDCILKSIIGLSWRPFKKRRYCLLNKHTCNVILINFTLSPKIRSDIVLTKRHFVWKHFL